MRGWTAAQGFACCVWLVGAVVTPASAEVPFPACANVPGCSDPSDYASYLFLDPADIDLTDQGNTGFPNDAETDSGDFWKFDADTGMDIIEAWTVTTGRPDVVAAVLDSGIFWEEADLRLKIALNTGELPTPDGCAVHDCNADGVVNVADYESRGCGGTALGAPLDAQDLIQQCSDGVDDDANGYVDDIAGWDFHDADNDAFDIVRAGHGTGEGKDGYSEAHNGGGFPGVAPSAMFIPLKVGDHFIAMDSDFQQAVVYAVDRGVDLISEALGTLNVSQGSQAALDYAYESGIPVIASAADEESRHHNMPAFLEHVTWVNSIVESDGTIVEDEVYDVLNGCTNYGGKAWAAIPSNGCSSEATGRAGGLTALLISHGKNLVDRGELSPYPGLDKPFSAEEVRQLFRWSAEDIDHSGDFMLTMNSLVSAILSGSTPETQYVSMRFPSQPGWEQFFGYGKPLAPAMLSVAEDTIPPEADLSGSLQWFQIVDPEASAAVDVVGTAASVRRAGDFDYTVEVGCGISPTEAEFSLIGDGSGNGKLEKAVLAVWDPGQTAADCAFDPAARAGPPGDDFARGQDPADFYTVTLRLQVVDALGNLGEDRRTVAVHTDPTHRFAPRYIGASGEGSPVLVDLDRDGVQEIVYGTGDGAVHAFRGDTGEELPGFPVFTDEIPVNLGTGYGTGIVPIPHEGIIGPVAAGDLDGDARFEIVAASIEGKLYVWDDHGRRLAGFPVASLPELSDPANRDRYNDSDPGIISAPTLANIDGPGGDAGLEIVHGSFDGHVYAWRRNGQLVSGFPVRLADRARVSVDDATGKITPITDGVNSRLTKTLSSPAVGDLDGDGWPEIVISTNEEYDDLPGPGGEDPKLPFFTDSNLVNALLVLAPQLGFDDFGVDTQGRLYAVRATGNDHADGPFLPGWPVKVPILVAGLLPTVGTGLPGSPVLMDLDGNGALTTGMFGIGGPGLFFNPDGTSRFEIEMSGELFRRPLDVDFPPPGFGNNLPETAGSFDAPFFPALGSGAFGDITGDGNPEYVAATAGIHKLLDVLAPAQQKFGHHHISAWDPQTGDLLPAFPQPMDDMQFISTPGLADVDGDGVAEVIQGSGAYLLRAYRGDGSVPADWPKFTHGWIIPAPTAGDVDGDGRNEVVSFTREGWFFVYDTQGVTSETAIPWQGFGGDRQNTQNVAAGVPRTETAGDPVNGLLYALEAIGDELTAQLMGGGISNAGMIATFAVGYAIGALEDGQVRQAVSVLPWIQEGLSGDPDLEDEYALFADALRRAAQRSAQTLDCGGDATCGRQKTNAEWYSELGDWMWDVGADSTAVFLWGRVLLIVDSAGG